MRTRERKRLEVTAYHEAGHVVLAYLARRRVREVTIIPDVAQGSLGHCKLWRHPSSFQPGVEASEPRALRRIERAILVNVAGSVAEAIFTGRHSHIYASGDMEYAVGLAEYTAGDPDEAGAYVGWLYTRARNILRHSDYWRAVQALAVALVEHRRLGARQTYRIMTSMLGPARL